jgi:hypothetical protein
VIVGNNLYDWNGQNSAKYDLLIDANSSQYTIVGNSFGFYSAAPTNIATAALPFVELAENTPLATPYANYKPLGVFSGSTPAVGIGGTGLTTIYLGAVAGTTEPAAELPLAFGQGGLIECMSVMSSAAPATGETWTYTFDKSGAASGLTMTQNAGAASASICSQANGPVFTQNDFGDIKVTTNGSTNLGGIQFRYSFAAYQ